MDIPKAVTCQSVGGTVYVRDERGNLVDTLSFPQSVTAQSFGSGISVPEPINSHEDYLRMLKEGRVIPLQRTLPV